MALDINTIKQASPKANQVATEQYVDTSIADIDVTQDISANNDIFAQKLGYLNYASMVAAASTGQTIINGGYVNTGLIQANAIVANQINTTGLIAENISADKINGITINGGVINGARINGSVIKASYLDLDGELEVLTNYHITVAIYNANPSLYTDAVYISGTNEYRIPTLSTIRENTISKNITTVSTIYGVMWSYNTANVGNNLKAVKIRPIWNNQVGCQLFRSVSSDTYFGYNHKYGVKNQFRLSLGSTLLVECTLKLMENAPYNGNDDTTVVTISGSQFETITLSHYSFNYSNYNHSYNIDIGIGILTISVDFSSGSSAGSGSDGDSSTIAPNRITIVGFLNTGSKLLPFDWTSGRLKFEQVVAPSLYSVGSKSEYTVFSLNQSIHINNMV